MNQLANNANLTINDPRWLQVLAKDASADGIFYYSVSTTGVYCKPSCASRPARPEHVAFHMSFKSAERAGFRACKRCKPTQPSLLETRTKMVTEICRMIETAQQNVNLATLAATAGLSMYHFHRIFKAVTGLTPKAYWAAHRAQKIRAELNKNATITDAIFEVGYNSNSRFYEQSSQLLGMTPSNFKSGGSNAVIRFALGECALGSILVASSELGVCAIFLGDNPEKLLQELQNTFLNADIIGADLDYERLVAKVVGFIETPAIGLDLPLDIRGTAFQQRVWQALREIPAGKTLSYSQLAQKIGKPKAVRAVASACAANKIAVAIPCHRVMRMDGALSGYRWGLVRKANLLDKESKK